MGSDKEHLHVTKPPDTAAGKTAITESLRQVFGKMGPVRGTRGLLNLNQKGGIDCQSCAWPDPDGKRTVAEFCESGAKALADEGTTKHVTADFFAQYSLSELSEKDEFWLNAQGRLTEPVAHVERGRIPLPALCPAVRHEQSARLLEHVPRIVERGAGRIDRDREGDRSSIRF